MKIGLLSYRSNPFSGGQGIYVKHLSLALTKLGHQVDVISGPPYPDLHEDINLIKIPSLNLFELDEMILFAFYACNKHRYKNVLDLGANIGLHSIILGLSGFNVNAYEPDPGHFGILLRNLSLNHSENVVAHNLAVAETSKTVEFTRVLGNTMSSHISGSKKPYGQLEHFTVIAVSFKETL